MGATQVEKFKFIVQEFALVKHSFVSWATQIKVQGTALPLRRTEFFLFLWLRHNLKKGLRSSELQILEDSHRPRGKLVFTLLRSSALLSCFCIKILWHCAKSGATCKAAQCITGPVVRIKRRPNCLSKRHVRSGTVALPLCFWLCTIRLLGQNV